MPIYEYTCAECGHVERLALMSERDAQTCECGQPLSRGISRNTSAHFKGPGFYVNDYGRKSDD